MKHKRKRICIIGLGLFGSQLARSLAKDNEVLAIDIHETMVNNVKEEVQRALILDASNYDSLASVVDADFDEGIVGISEHMEASILCTLHLKKIGVKRVLAKAFNKDHEMILRKIGADRIIFPERDSAERLAMQINHDNLLDYIPLAKGYQVMDVTPPPAFVGHSLIELGVRNRFGVFIVAIRQTDTDEFIFLPNPSYEIRTSDVLVVMGMDKDLDKIEKIKE